MAFFSHTSFQAKRKFRWTVNFGIAGGDMVFMAKTVSKPSYTMESTPHRFLNHEFKYPNIVKWQDINVTFVDAVSPNVGSRFYSLLKNTGYNQPDTEGMGFTGGVTKGQSVAALGEITIRQLDGGGVDVVDPKASNNPLANVNVIDEWRLKNAFINSVKFGDLAYGEDDLVQIEAVLSYDWAYYNVINSPYVL